MKLSNVVITKTTRMLTAIFSASILLTNFAAPFAARVSAATAPSAKISFTFDDGEVSAYTLAAPALQKYGYAGVDYVTSGCIGMTTVPNDCAADGAHAYMSWDQVKALKDVYGWEVGSHTATHPLLASTDPESQPTALTKQQVINELLNSKNDITSGSGITPVNFATPYGDYQPDGHPVISEIAKLYATHRGFADTGYNVFPYNDYLLVDQQVQGGVSVATVKGYIDQAIANKTWLILTFHHIVASGASTDPDDYEYNVADLEAIAAYAQSKGLAGATINSGIASNNGNLLTNGSFNTAISSNTADTTVWSTDSPATIKQDTAGNGSYPDATNSLAFASGATATHLFSPVVPIAAKPYVVKAFVNMETADAAKGEVGFFVDEYTAAGVYLTTQYKKAWSVFASTNPRVRQHAFEYTPTAGATSARLQIVFPAASAETGFIDNVQFWAQDGSTTGNGSTTTPVTPPTSGKAGDVNNDGKVGAPDLSILLSNWGKGTTRDKGDLNGDGKVTAADLSILLSNWGK